MDLEIGRIVISMAGRDKGRYQAVVDITDEYALVADGNLRKISEPKRKNPKHLSLTKTVFSGNTLENDKLLREAILTAFGADRR